MNIKTSFFLFLLLAALNMSCMDEMSATNVDKQSTTSSPAIGETVVVTGAAPTICNYDLNETALTSAGWTKIFEDDFTSDLSKWNIWTGGAFNEELEYYQASNLQVANGVLAIVAKRETVTGPTTTYDATPKT